MLKNIEKMLYIEYIFEESRIIAVCGEAGFLYIFYQISANAKLHFPTVDYIVFYLYVIKHDIVLPQL